MGQTKLFATEPQRCEPALDLVHLSRQTLGDAKLEREILGLFASQTRLYIDRMQNATTAEERNMAVHTILGSARSVGAWRVASAAEKCREAGHCADSVRELVHSVSATQAFIRKLLLEGGPPLTQVG